MRAKADSSRENSNTPFYVDVKAEVTAEYADCFNNVRVYAEEYGGDITFGWNIFEHAEIMLEAEYHAIWQPADGEPVDITPNPLKAAKHLFLPEDNIKYDFDNDNKRINNRRFALSQHPCILKFFKVLDNIYEFEEKLPEKKTLLNEADSIIYYELQASKNKYLFEIINANKRLSNKRRRGTVKKKKR